MASLVSIRCEAECWAHDLALEVWHVTSKTVTSARIQMSMGKDRLMMHNMRHVAPIIQISFSLIYEGKIYNLRYYIMHD